MKTFERYVAKQNIKLILFENNPERCVDNNLIRIQTNNKKNVLADITNFTSKYDTNEYTNLGYKYTILPVFN
jgi:hypothetical protein